MSYDTTLMADVGGPELVPVGEVRNCTCNNYHIFKAAGLEMKYVHGTLASEVIPVLEKALHYLTNPDNRESLLKLEPENK